MGSLVLAVLVPERYQQMITRGAEYGNDRILIGAHYAMDVMAGRTLATYDLAYLLANDPAYLDRTFLTAAKIKDFQAAIKAAHASITATLEAACGKTVQQCAGEDTGRLSSPAANEAFYADTQTYNLPIVYSKTANSIEDVGMVAAEAGYLLTIAYPSLTLEQADQILTETEGPGGGFLDDGSHRAPRLAQLCHVVQRDPWKYQRIARKIGMLGESVPGVLAAIMRHGNPTWVLLRNKIRMARYDASFQEASLSILGG
jgi:hypothetical protein